MLRELIVSLFLVIAILPPLGINSNRAVTNGPNQNGKGGKTGQKPNGGGGKKKGDD